MRKYLITLKPAPNDHKVAKQQLEAILNEMGIDHQIESLWHWGSTKAIVKLSPTNVHKIEKLDSVQYIVAA